MLLLRFGSWAALPVGFQSSGTKPALVGVYSFRRPDWIEGRGRRRRGFELDCQSWNSHRSHLLFLSGHTRSVVEKRGRTQTGEGQKIQIRATPARLGTDQPRNTRFGIQRNSKVNVLQVTSIYYMESELGGKYRRRIGGELQLALPASLQRWVSAGCGTTVSMD